MEGKQCNASTISITWHGHSDPPLQGERVDLGQRQRVVVLAFLLIDAWAIKQVAFSRAMGAIRKDESRS